MHLIKYERADALALEEIGVGTENVVVAEVRGVAGLVLDVGTAGEAAQAGVESTLDPLTPDLARGERADDDENAGGGIVKVAGQG